MTQSKMWGSGSVLQWWLYLVLLLPPPCFVGGGRSAVPTSAVSSFALNSSLRCFTHVAPTPYYHYGPSTYRYCHFTNVCLAQHSRQVCGKATIGGGGKRGGGRSIGRPRSCVSAKELLYFQSPTAAPAPSFRALYTCPSNYGNTPWCKLPVRAVLAEPSLTSATSTWPQRLFGRDARAEVSPLPTYIVGRWKHRNPVEYMLEGFWAPLYAALTRYGLAQLRDNVSFVFLDPFVMDPVHDWAAILFSRRVLTLLPTNHTHLWCFAQALVGTPLVYHAVPEPAALLLMQYLRQQFFAYANRTSAPPVVIVAPIRILVYIKPQRGFHSMGGTVVNPELMLAVLRGMSPFEGRYPLEVESLSLYWNPSPQAQLARIQPVDVYISDGGTAAFMGLFLAPGSAAIRLAKCPSSQCLCEPRSHTMFYWFSFNISRVRYLWYAAANRSYCVSSGSFFTDVRVEPVSFRRTAAEALRHVLRHKRGVVGVS